LLRHQGLLWMVLASTLFAVMNVCVRLGAREVAWQQVAAARTTVGALVAVAVALVRGAPLFVVDQKKAWGRSLFGTGAMLCCFYALGAPEIALGDAVTLGATTPIFIALLAPWLLGEPANRWAWLATLLAFVGVALVVGPTFHIAGGLAVIATAGAMLSAIAMMLLRRLGRESPEAIALHFAIVASVVTLGMSVPVWRTPDLGGALALVATGVTGGLAQLAMTRAYALERAARVGTVGYLGVVLSHVLAALVLHEEPSPHQVIGTVLVSAAGIVVAWRMARESAAERRSEPEPAALVVVASVAKANRDG
jgi:drug/metabolite transporter (DMT)-like permease